ncbi:NAD(P)/FAD-dependent oxidoreductase [Amycolatopsis albispora]|uniref:Oxidoreductase n=1 Tax=Amycolatopsis albispora TaxID=1804986 RepID=A0A344LKM4_9PSEU|nr:FAD-dependent oxidoreductase [Amycolatopsis albispora]AXB48598.1 oxidoreductase [Amycolatopsis albispora]
MRVLVIGSGIAGASTAYQLARRGADVVLAGHDHDGVATAAGAGIVSPWTSRRTDEEYHLAARAAAFYPTLVEQLAEDGHADSSFEIVGAMVVSADADELDAAEQRVTERAATAPGVGEIQRLIPDEAREYFPALAPELGAVHISGGGRVDGRHLRAALLGASAKRGVRSISGAAELLVDRGKVTGARVGGEVVSADVVVVAAGAWTDELLAPVNLRLGIEPQRGQISHLELPGTPTDAWPVVLPISSHYLLAFPGSRVVVGATRETGSGFDYRVTAAGQREVLDNALAVAPGLADATLLETRIGFRPAAPDGLPVLGSPDGHAELVVVTGFGPAGLTLAPYAGHVIAAELLGAPVDDDLAAYRPDRFIRR